VGWPWYPPIVKDNEDLFQDSVQDRARLAGASAKRLRDDKHPVADPMDDDTDDLKVRPDIVPNKKMSSHKCAKNINYDISTPVTVTVSTCNWYLPFIASKAFIEPCTKRATHNYYSTELHPLLTSCISCHLSNLQIRDSGCFLVHAVDDQC
jgi:hypothetical protein